MLVCCTSRSGHYSLKLNDSNSVRGLATRMAAPASTRAVRVGEKSRVPSEPEQSRTGQVLSLGGLRFLV